MILQNGNSKIHKSVQTFSIPPVVTCPNCLQCAKTCYALKAYRMYPSVKTSWDSNYQLSQTIDFIPAISAAIKSKHVRIHVAGDFYSQEYLNKWIAIANMHPKVKFFTYTKTSWNFSEVPRNLNIINSLTETGGLNYGNREYVDQLVSEGYFKCPAKGCGDKYKYCHTNKKVCFLIH